jgi:DNA polymerase-1
MEKKVFLLDAYALVFRAYYALIRSPRISSKGKNTNAQFGFTNTLVELITKQKPSHMAVCFDTSAPTERHTDFADYKANRQETPEDISAAVPDIEKIIEGFNIPVIAIDGYEADDVIGTLSKKGELAGYEVYMVTPDKDYGQLVSEKVKIYKPAYQGGDVEIMGPKEVCAKWNIANVNQVIDMLAMMGDAVDNIPGIAGVGEKTAAKLLAEYGSLENTLANADKIKGAMGEKVRKGQEMAILSKKLATITTNVPVEFHEEDFRLKEWDKEKLKKIFDELEFRTLGKRILGEEFVASVPTRSVVEKQIPQGVQTDLFGNIIESPEEIPEAVETSEPVTVSGRNINNTAHEYIAVEDDDAIKKLVAELKKHDEISFDTETTGIDANDAELVGLSFAIEPGKGWYVPCPPDQDKTKQILSFFIPLFNDKKKTWIGQNIKYDLLVLKWYGIEMAGELFDTMLAHYVIDPDGKRGMDLLSERFLGYEPVHIEELIGKKGKSQGTMRDVPIEQIKEYAAEDADITLQLKNAFQPMLGEKDVEKVFSEVENPLVRCWWIWNMKASASTLIF